MNAIHRGVEFRISSLRYCTCEKNDGYLTFISKSCPSRGVRLVLKGDGLDELRIASVDQAERARVLREAKLKGKGT